MHKNHIDIESHMKALPIAYDADTNSISDHFAQHLQSSKGYIDTPLGQVEVTLFSDSLHLHHFFRGNWGQARTKEIPIVSRSRNVALRSNDPEGKRHSRHRYVDANRSTLLSFGNEYYGNVKISVRGLCTASMTDSIEGGFLHGCATKLSDVGVIIAGSSGAGKTTLTRSMMERFGDNLAVINDDWGWADGKNRTLAYTGEPKLHMKYRSVKALRPELEIGPETYDSENYHGDPDNPHARLLVPRSTVYSKTTDEAVFGAIFFVISDKSESRMIWEAQLKDLDLIEASQYSAFYDRHESFMDGSLIMTNPQHFEEQRRRFSRLREMVPMYIVNNVGAPDSVGKELCAYLERVISKT